MANIGEGILQRPSARLPKPVDMTQPLRCCGAGARIYSRGNAPKRRGVSPRGVQLFLFCRASIDLRTERTLSRG